MREGQAGAAPRPHPLTVEAEAEHGTVTRHDRQHQPGKQTSTNPIGSVFACTRGQIYRGKVDGTPDVSAFAETREKLCVATAESGPMTRDQSVRIGPDQSWMNTQDFLAKLDENLKTAMPWRRIAHLQQPPARGQRLLRTTARWRLLRQ